MHVQRKKKIIRGCASDHVFRSQEALTNKPKNQKKKKKKTNKKRRNKHVREGERKREEKKEETIYICVHTATRKKERNIYYK